MGSGGRRRRWNGRVPRAQCATCGWGVSRGSVGGGGVLAGGGVFGVVCGGASPLKFGQSGGLFEAVLTGMNWASPSVTLPNGLHVSPGQAMGGFLKRLLGGLVFENSKYVNSTMTKPGEFPVAATPYDSDNFGAPTAIHAGRFFAPRLGRYLANYAIHEQLHSLSAYDGTSTYHCATYQAANQLVRGPSLHC